MTKLQKFGVGVAAVLLVGELGLSVFTLFRFEAFSKTFTAVKPVELLAATPSASIGATGAVGLKVVPTPTPVLVRIEVVK